MKKKRYTTDENHFKIFVKECKKWIKVYGLTDYDITFHHEKVNHTLGDVDYHIFDRWAKIRLSKDFGPVEPTDYEIRNTALHEVYELMLAELYAMATFRYALTQEDLNGAKHKIIQRLINAHFNRDDYNENT